MGMDMEKLIELIEKELKQISEKGLSSANLETTGKLIDMYKDLKEVGKEGSYMAYGAGGYNTNQYQNQGGYGRDPYSNRGGYNDYMNSGGYGRQGGYNGYDGRMREHLARINEGAEMYEYGRDRYRHGGGESGMHEGLEKLMYSLCSFIESTLDFAQSPQEKDIVRRHIQKLRSM